MVKFSKIKIIYDSAPIPPKGVYLDRTYSILKKHDNLYVTDGNAEIQMGEQLIKMLFKIQDEDLTWENIEFTESKQSKKKLDIEVEE